MPKSTDIRNLSIYYRWVGHTLVQSPWFSHFSHFSHRNLRQLKGPRPEKGWFQCCGAETEIENMSLVYLGCTLQKFRIIWDENQFPIDHEQLRRRSPNYQISKKNDCNKIIHFWWWWTVERRGITSFTPMTKKSFAITPKFWDDSEQFSSVIEF